MSINVGSPTVVGKAVAITWSRPGAAKLRIATPCVTSIVKVASAGTRSFTPECAGTMTVSLLGRTNRTLESVRVTVAAVPTAPVPAPAPPPTPAAPGPLATWRTLVLVIRETRFTLPDGRLMVGNWTRQLEYDRALAIARNWPNTINSWSGGMCRLDAKVVEVPLLTRLSPIWNGWWAAQEDVQEHINAHMPDADSVITVVDMDDDPNGVTAFHWGGLGRGGIPTYACVPLADGHQFWWLDGVNDDEAMTHEWLHGVEPFLVSRGFPMPDLHAADAYGFPEGMEGPGTGWSAWYKAFLTGKVPRGDGSLFGCTAAAWKSGTPR